MQVSSEKCDPLTAPAGRLTVPEYPSSGLTPRREGPGHRPGRSRGRHSGRPDAGGPLRLDPADIDDAIAILFEQFVVRQNVMIHNSRQARVVDEEGCDPVVAPPGPSRVLHQRL